MQGASYTPPTLPCIIKLPGGRSYHTQDTGALADYLTAARWRRYPPKAGNELCRFWRDDALILIYLSGSFVAGGRRPEIAHNELGALLPEPEGKQLTLWEGGQN